MTGGVIWAIATALAFSVSHITLAKGLPGVGVARGTTAILVISAVVVGMVTLGVDGVSPLVGASAFGVVAFAIAGLLHFGGWGLMNASIKRVGPSRMASITGVTPMFAAVLATLVLHEHLNPTVGAGIVLIVAGTYFIAVS